MLWVQFYLHLRSLIGGLKSRNRIVFCYTNEKFQHVKYIGHLKKVDVAEAPQLENFGSKIKGKSFPFSSPHGLKLQKPINAMASVLEPGHVPDPKNPRLKI